MKSLLLIAVSCWIAGTAHADGTCPTTDVLGTYRTKSVSCTDGSEAQHSDLDGIRLSAPANTPEGIDAQIDFLGWNISWGVYRNSTGGTTEACEDSSGQKYIRRSFDGAVQEIRFTDTGATVTWPFYGGPSCTWTLIKR